LPNLYSFADFYNYRESYDSFRNYASWKPEEVETIDVADMSARLGMRGAFEILVKFEGSSLQEHMNFHESWYQLVERYSIRKLTKEEDKVMAIQGIAYFIETIGSFRFVAGLWEQFLPFNLLWVLQDDSPLQRPPRSIPTWSWASVDGQISHRPKAASKTVQKTEWDEINILIRNEVVESDGTLRLTCSLVEFGSCKVNWIPDVTPTPPSEELTCLPILSLNSARRFGCKRAPQIRGIVLRVESSGGNEYKRVGYFWTRDKAMEKSVSESSRTSIRIY
jgi:hypothetical protein